MNGAGFNNRTFTIPDSVSLLFAKIPARFAIYDSAVRATIAAQIAELNPNFAGDASSLSGTLLTFAFRGNRTGVYEGPSAGAQLILGNRQFAAGDTTATGTGVISNTSFRVNVTQYDNARVQGRYTGTFREINSPAGATVTVTGEFNVQIIAPNNLIIPILPGSAHQSLRDLSATAARSQTSSTKP